MAFEDVTGGIADVLNSGASVVDALQKRRDAAAQTTPSNSDGLFTKRNLLLGAALLLGAILVAYIAKRALR